MRGDFTGLHEARPIIVDKRGDFGTLQLHFTKLRHHRCAPVVVHGKNRFTDRATYGRNSLTCAPYYGWIMGIPGQELLFMGNRLAELREENGTP